MKTRIILSINNLNTAGMKYVLASIAMHIDKSKFTPVIAVNNKTGSDLEKKLEAHFKIIEFNLRNPGAFSFITALKNNMKVLRLNGDLVHSFDYSSDWFEAMSVKMAGIKYITEKTNLSFSSYRWRMKHILADHIIYLSSAQSNYLNKNIHKATLIPTGVNIAEYSNAVAASRSDLGIQQTDTVLISVAHLVEVKGYEELINAMATLKDTYENLKIVCVGRGTPDYENKLKMLAQKQNVAERFIFTGNSEQVASLMKMADGKILATQNYGRREAFGAVLVEAMAAGLPVIATRSGGPEDIVVEDVTGWLVHGDGHHSLVEGIIKFMEAKIKWKEIGNNGYRRAITFYDEIKMVKAYENVYMKVIGGDLKLSRT